MKTTRVKTFVGFLGDVETEANTFMANPPKHVIAESCRIVSSQMYLQENVSGVTMLQQSITISFQVNDALGEA